MGRGSDEPRATTKKVDRRVMDEMPNENADPTIASQRNRVGRTLWGHVTFFERGLMQFDTFCAGMNEKSDVFGVSMCFIYVVQTLFQQIERIDQN